jgi:hypothetical protein
MRLINNCSNDTHVKISTGINKNVILNEYQATCAAKGFTSTATSTTKKGEKPTKIPTTFPMRYQLLQDCTMKPSRQHYYQVKNLHSDNIIIFIINKHKSYLTNNELDILRSMNKHYQKMIDDIL